MSDDKVASWAFDPTTGIVRTTGECPVQGNEIPAEKNPKKSCTRCFGRGWVGRTVGEHDETGKKVRTLSGVRKPCTYVPCSCIRPISARKPNW